MAFCEMTKVDYFIVWSTSRFARNMLEAKLNKRRLLKAGTRVMYCTAEIAESDSGFLHESILELFDEHQSIQIAADTRRSMAKNSRDGFFNGGRLPFGYRSEIHPDNNKRKILVPDEDESRLVIRIFELRLEGYGAKAIADLLNNQGIMMRRERWTKKRITSILRNTKMIGQTIYGKRNHQYISQDQKKWIVTDSHKPIISQETWCKVQKIMDDLARPDTTGSPLSQWLFTGMLRCGHCGHLMQAYSGRNRSKTYHYYDCRTHRTGEGCQSQAIRADKLDSWFSDEICARIFSPKNIKNIADHVNVAAKQWAAEKKTTGHELEAELDQLRKKNDRLYSILEDPAGALTIAELSPRIKSNNDRILSIKRSLDEIDRAQPPKYPEITPSELSEFLISMLKNDETKQLKRRFISSFVSKMEMKQKQITIEYVPDALLAGEKLNVHSRGKWLPYQALLRTVRLNLMFPGKKLNEA
jgi:DNA invertase Pin-like site-specific DNA recombinase